MIQVRCPICGRRMESESSADWPQFPFCSPRCQLIDLGRWLGEAYRVPDARGDAEATDSPQDPEIP